MESLFHLDAYDPWARALAILIDSGAKGILLLSLAAAVVSLMRKSSAAARHLVWALSLCGLLLLPLLSLVVPKWQLPILPCPQVVLTESQAPIIASSIGDRSSRVPPSVDISSGVPPLGGIQSHEPESAVARTVSAPIPPAFWVMSIWLVVALITIAPLVIGILTLARMLKIYPPFKLPYWDKIIHALAASLGLNRPVRVLQSGPETMPMATGLLRAAILLPASAADWGEDKRRSVLLHELAHVKRRDCLTHALARIAVSLHWFNPLAWFALRRMRIERERACDDMVLTAGERPSAYADHLVEIARSFRAGTLASAAVITMVHKSQLEDRVMAILDQTQIRRQVTLRLFSIILVLVGIAVWLCSSVVLSAESSENAREEALKFYSVCWGHIQHQWNTSGEVGKAPDAALSPILVIDCAAGEMRLERPGKIRPYERINLPAGWDWQVTQWTQNNSRILLNPVRLRIRTAWNSEAKDPYPEMFELRGVHRISGQKVGLHIQDSGGGYSGDGFTEKVSFSVEHNPTRISQLVSQAEYDATKKTWSKFSEKENGLQTQWTLFQSAMSLKLREHLVGQYWDISNITVKPSQDFRVGKIGVTAFRHPGSARSGKSHILTGMQDGYELRHLGGASWSLTGYGGLAGDNLAISGDPQGDSTFNLSPSSMKASPNIEFVNWISHDGVTENSWRINTTDRLQIMDRGLILNADGTAGQNWGMGVDRDGDQGPVELSLRARREGNELIITTMRRVGELKQGAGEYDTYEVNSTISASMKPKIAIPEGATFEYSWRKDPVQADARNYMALWEGRFVRDGKIIQTVVYAAAIAPMSDKDFEKALELHGRAGDLPLIRLDESSPAVTATGNRTTTSVLALRWVATNQERDKAEKLPPHKGELSKDEVPSFWVQNEVQLSERDVALAEVLPNSSGKDYVISLKLTEDGKKRFAELTARNIGRQLAIVINGEVISAPNVNEPITGGKAQISGGFSRKQAEEIVAAMKQSNPAIASGPAGTGFGPVHECVLNDTGENCLIDFDKDRLLSTPRFDGDTTAAFAWIDANGIDAGCGNESTGLVGMEIIAVPWPNSFWETANGKTLSEDPTFKHGKPGEPVFLSARGDLPVTYAFKTREGGVGILQIIEFVGQRPSGVKIQYKMVRAE